MSKIIVVGSSGAGKTTLAKNISTKLGIPHLELDSLHHQKNWKQLDQQEFTKRVEAVTSQSDWVICGNYFNKLGGLEYWSKADMVIWCDYSFPLVFSRLLRRTLKRTITRQILWNENRERFIENFFTKDSVLLWMMRQWNDHQKRYGAIFKANNLPTTQLVRLKNPKETELFLKRMSK